MLDAYEGWLALGAVVFGYCIVERYLGVSIRMMDVQVKEGCVTGLGKFVCLFVFPPFLAVVFVAMFAVFGIPFVWVVTWLADITPSQAWCVYIIIGGIGGVVKHIPNSDFKST